MPKRLHDKGIKCPLCGSYNTKVAYTDPKDGNTLRQRKCGEPDCAGEVTTIEKPIGELLSNLTESIGKQIQVELREIVETANKSRL